MVVALDDFPTADAHPGQDEFPSAAPAEGAVDFGWDDERKLGGRRRKAEAKKKAKPGSFGEQSRPVYAFCSECNIRMRCNRALS